MASITVVETRPTGTIADGAAYFESSTNNFIVYDATNASWLTFASDGVGAGFIDSYSLNFDGANDLLSLTSLITPESNTGTVSAWIKTAYQANQTVFSQSHNLYNYDNYIQFMIDSSGRAAISTKSVQNGGPNYLLIQHGSSVINDGEWHHVAWVSDAVAWKIYIDGNEEGQLTTQSTSGTHSGPWFSGIHDPRIATIGSLETRVSYSRFNGNIDELSIFDYAFTQLQISSLIDTSGSSPKPADISSLNLNPSGWWRMGEVGPEIAVDGEKVSSIFDSSENENHAIAFGEIKNGDTATEVNQPTYSVDTP